MLHSDDKIIQTLKAYFKSIGVGMELNDKKLIIRDSLISVRIVIHLIIAMWAIEFISAIKTDLYLTTILFLYGIMAYILFWVDYKSINIIEFDLLNKYLSVRNRSIVRRIIHKYINPQPSKYYFEEIGALEITDKIRILLPIKHLVHMRMKNGEGIELIGFSNKTNSKLFSEFITTVIN